MNGRLDTIQAAVLIEKLKIFPDEIDGARPRGAALQCVARRHRDACRRCRPASARCGRSTRSACRPGGAIALAAALRAQGIPTAQYYPKPTHRQTAYRHYPVADGGLPVTDRLADEVISLPMHAYLDEATQDRIVAAVRGALRA